MSSLPTVIAGALHPSLQLTWRRQGAPAVTEDLSGAALTGVIRDGRASIVRAIAGQLVLVDGPGGVFRWDFDLTDVATPGAYDVEFKATWSVGRSPAKTFAASWIVAASYQP